MTTTAPTYIELTSAERATIRNEEKRLRACSVQWLREELHRSRRVYDSKGLTKLEIVFELLRCQFGAKAVASAYRPFVAQEVAWRDDRGNWKRRVIKTEAAYEKFAAKMEDEAREWNAREADGVVG